MAGSALALAAASPTYQNPFGLNTTGRGVPTGPLTPDGLMTPPQKPAGQTGTGTAPPMVMPLPTTPATTPGAAAAPTATMNTSFDLQTDPALQQVNAIAGLSDQQATAQALKERQQQLLQYGDPRLAAAVLGQNDPFVQAAGQNQESDLAMLGRERDQNLHQFETQLDPSLTFSGYRVGQEQQLGQAYQDALAKAAAGVQGNLDSITGNLDSALNQNALSRANALEQAYRDELAIALSGGGGTQAPAPAPANAAYIGPVPGAADYASGAQPDPFANLGNLSPQDWANFAARAGMKVPS